MGEGQRVPQQNCSACLASCICKAQEELLDEELLGLPPNSPELPIAQPALDVLSCLQRCSIAAVRQQERLAMRPGHKRLCVRQHERFQHLAQLLHISHIVSAQH
eukprot:8901074-Alexandrium_andersonii.AAC.1